MIASGTTVRTSSRPAARAAAESGGIGPAVGELRGVGVAVLVAGAGVLVAGEVLMLAGRLDALTGAWLAGCCRAGVQPAQSATRSSRDSRRESPLIR
jgi:hypothetical protein